MNPHDSVHRDVDDFIDPDVGRLGGGLHLLRAISVIDRPREELFPFFAAAENLERITPPELRFRIVTEGPVAMHEGTLIDYRLRLNGIPFGWRTEITECDPRPRGVSRPTGLRAHPARCAQLGSAPGCYSSGSRFSGVTRDQCAST